MSEEREPIRLRDDPSEDPQLRALLDAARGESADAAMLDRVLGNVVGGGGGGSTPAAKIGAAVGASAIGAAAIALVISSITPTPTSVTPRIGADAFVSPDALVVADAFVPSDAGTDAFVPVRSTQRVPPPSTETDGELLMRATRARAADPAASHALAIEHRTRFPGSPLAEEREALVILDLADLGRTDAATRAAADFRARWPHSTSLPHIDAALARARSAAP